MNFSSLKLNQERNQTVLSSSYRRCIQITSSSRTFSQINRIECIDDNLRKNCFSSLLSWCSDSDFSLEKQILSERFRIRCQRSAEKLEKQLTSGVGESAERWSARRSRQNCHLRDVRRTNSECQIKESSAERPLFGGWKGKIWKQRPARFSVSLPW
jgi:hypothetical protein